MGNFDTITQLKKAMKHMPLEIIDECIVFLMNRELNIRSYSYNTESDTFDKFKTTLTYLKSLKPNSLPLVVQLLKEAKSEFIQYMDMNSNELVDEDFVPRPNHESLFLPKYMDVNYHRKSGFILGIVN
jgi:hypothetical protein